jgi:hypothetical protein
VDPADIAHGMEQQAGRGTGPRRYTSMQLTVRSSGAGRGTATLVATLLFCAVTFTTALADQAPGAPNSTIPSGTRLRFHLSAPLASDRNKAGDTFAFAMLDPVVIDGRVLVAQGAVGSGTVLVSGHNGTSGHEGDLTLRLDSLRAADSGSVHFADQKFTINGRNRRVMSGMLGLVPWAGLSAPFIRGKEIHVDTTTPIETVLLHPALLTDSTTAPAPVTQRG